MFSQVYASRLEKVYATSRAVAARTCAPQVPEAFKALDSSISDLLWAADMGTGGDLDATILARSIAVKESMHSGSLYAIVPLYVTSVCIEACVYCNYRAHNKHAEIERVRLTDEELLLEAQHLIDTNGLRVIELVYATDPRVRIDSMCRHVEQVRRLLDQRGGGIVGLNAEALDEHEYRMLLDAGISFIVLWQETYDKSRYAEFHPGKTKKNNFFYRLEAYERMISAGMVNIGMGILSGLSDWRTDWAMLMEHEAYLHSRYDVTPAILGVPRLKPAAGALLKETAYIPSRQEFLMSLAIHNLFSPRTMPFINTREDWSLCVKMAAGGGCLFTFNCSTIPGGYSLGRKGYQFPTASYDTAEHLAELRSKGLKPAFDWRFETEAMSVGVEERAVKAPAQ